MYESGKSYPKLEAIDLLAKTLNVNPEDLYDDIIMFLINIKDEIQILKNKMSYEEIACYINSNHRTIRDWHSGKHLPNAHMIKRLLKLKQDS